MRAYARAPARTAALLATAALAAPAAGCGGGEDTNDRKLSVPRDRETSVLDDPCTRASGARLKRFHVTDGGFRPRKIVVKSGIPIAFINCGKKPHTVTKVAGRGEDFDSGTLEPREKFERTFSTIGTHRLIDRHNPGAKMVIEVEGVGLPPQHP